VHRVLLSWLVWRAQTRGCGLRAAAAATDLWPLLGGTAGRPDDSRITALTLRKTVPGIPATGVHLRAWVGPDPTRLDRLLGSSALGSGPMQRSLSFDRRSTPTTAYRIPLRGCRPEGSVLKETQCGPHPGVAFIVVESNVRESDASR
jgi:hypothetical protein